MVTTAEQRRAWRKANPDKVREYQLRHQPRATAAQYGLTVGEVHALFAAQDGRCGVCAKQLVPWPSLKTHIDHDHQTGKVRGILCSSCNRCEGWVVRNGGKLRRYLSHPPADVLKDPT